MAKDVIITADKYRNRKKFGRVVKSASLILLAFLVVLYIILEIIYKGGSFAIILDKESANAGIAIYENLDNTQSKRKLEAIPVESMDNISWKWIPENVDAEADGSHNGENYMAYSFYVENQGKDKLHYWYEIVVDDVIRNVDEAIRIAIYQNGEKIVYAKKSSDSGDPEDGTTMFLEDLKETILLEQRKDFSPGDVDRYSIVIWLEGDDPDCVDAIKGGAMKMHMKISEEHIRKK